HRQRNITQLEGTTRAVRQSAHLNRITHDCEPPSRLPVRARSPPRRSPAAPLPSAATEPACAPAAPAPAPVPPAPPPARTFPHHAASRRNPRAPGHGTPAPPSTGSPAASTTAAVPMAARPPHGTPP